MEALIDYAFRNKGKVFFCTKGKELVAVSMFSDGYTYNIHYGATNVTECYSYVDTLRLCEVREFDIICWQFLFRSLINGIVYLYVYISVIVDNDIYVTSSKRLYNV